MAGRVRGCGAARRRRLWPGENGESGRALYGAAPPRPKPKRRSAAEREVDAEQDLGVNGDAFGEAAALFLGQVEMKVEARREHLGHRDLEAGTGDEGEVGVLAQP